MVRSALLFSGRVSVEIQAGFRLDGAVVVSAKFERWFDVEDA